MVSSQFFSYRSSESTRTRVCPGAPPELVHPACRGAGESAPPAPGSLTGADGGKAPHVVEQLADDGTGPGVQPVTVDAQVELDPAGLESELQRGVQGSEVQLLSVYLVSSERDFFFFFLIGETRMQRPAATPCPDSTSMTSFSQQEHRTSDMYQA